MKIIKLGHSCLLIESEGTRIIIDPGILSDVSKSLVDIGAIFVTHKHLDHFDPEKIKEILASNANAKIYTNTSVKDLLAAENIRSEILEHGNKTTVGTITVEAIGNRHAHMHPHVTPDQNTGYLFNDVLYHPGDSFTKPDRNIRFLALPIGGPWMKLSEAIDYATAVKPKVCFPIHDGIFKITINPLYVIPEKILTPLGIEYKVIHPGDQLELN